MTIITYEGNKFTPLSIEFDHNNLQVVLQYQNETTYKLPIIKIRKIIND